MAASFNIRGIPIKFPFEPYDIQKDYMEKVIECLQNESNAVLESPTGTGKTLCLLCASLAWLTIKKAQIQAQIQKGPVDEMQDGPDIKVENNYGVVQNTLPIKIETGIDAKQNVPLFKIENQTDFLESLQADLDQKAGIDTKKLLGFFSYPTIIYASRTHSQLYQVMQELKRTAYGHLNAIVIGSREQLCIHPDIIKEENNSTKIHMCRSNLNSRSCQFYNRVDKLKDSQEICNQTILDIEDLVKLGQTHRFCPYFMSKELKRSADIIFMPYNYLLDPVVRKALGVNLGQNIVIMDEAHNIERICEDSASIQLKSTDIALCLEEVTAVMKLMTNEPIDFDSEAPKDFTADELCATKEMFLQLEKTVDALPVTTSLEASGSTFDGDYIFEILDKAGINYSNVNVVSSILVKITQFISTVQEGPLQRKGDSLELFNSLLLVVFQSKTLEFQAKIKKCYKLHIAQEDSFKKGGGGDGWLSKSSSSKTKGKILNYWCFSPAFGMNMLMDTGIRSLILTSGTLAPLKPLISELELKVSACLENPHIVKSNQICIRIVTKGPDGTELNSNFENRNNPTYLSSLGRTILNLTRIIPDGLLIFFPSYPVMEKCRQYWEEDGLWANICNQKAIYVEPKQKLAFNTAMDNFYSRIKDPNYKGAIFMGVCRGKLSEGLDFADMNGRGVIITGLPYPPFKDPRVVLKRQYLDRCRVNDSELLSGGDWYTLEAIRAVNQAIGRVIRHKDDYGAIILLDSRFTYSRVQCQLSLWLRKQIKQVNNFGEIIRSLREFYRNANINLPVPTEKPAVSAFTSVQTYKRNANANFDFSTSSTCSAFNESAGSNLVTTANRNIDVQADLSHKRKRITIISSNESTSTNPTPETTTQEYIAMVKRALNSDDFKAFLIALTRYRNNCDLDDLTNRLDDIFINKFSLRYIIQGLFPYIKNVHKTKFNTYWEKMR